MKENIALTLNSLELLKHTLYKDYSFPEELEALNLTQERILMTVKYGHNLPMVTIARAIGLEKGPFSQTVDKLEALQLLVRQRSTTDKRTIFLQLTPKGKQLADIVEASMDAHFKTKLSALSPQALQDFLNALAVLHTTANLLNAK